MERAAEVRQYGHGWPILPGLREENRSVVGLGEIVWARAAGERVQRESGQRTGRAACGQGECALGGQDRHEVRADADEHCAASKEEPSEMPNGEGS